MWIFWHQFSEPFSNRIPLLKSGWAEVCAVKSVELVVGLMDEISKFIFCWLRYLSFGLVDLWVSSLSARIQSVCVACGKTAFVQIDAFASRARMPDKFSFLTNWSFKLWLRFSFPRGFLIMLILNASLPFSSWQVYLIRTPCLFLLKNTQLKWQR